MNHLNDCAKSYIKNASKKERIEYIDKHIFLGYSAATNILNNIKSCYNLPKKNRMPNILVVGDSNNGKTEILSHFVEKLPAYLEKGTEKPICHALLIQAPPEPDERRFYNVILETLHAPVKTSERIESRYSRVKNLLIQSEVKILLIDEIHHVLAGTPAKQRLFLNVIKHLSNDLKIPLVCAGTRLAFNAIQSDHQLANRFEPRILPRWTDDLEYKRLMLGFEQNLPLLKESNLIKASISRKVLAKSDGLIGEIAKILKLSTIMAIETGTEKITESIINKIDYISPAERKKAFYN
ncbi:AAA family ATPase [Marinifilum sp. N1E240]|uniref:TniB family NTP-binding protein n=1 Tax=Marinifilum sp. N1E240 TaxID=2608082 RepID=UPI00128E0DFF|nr:TniB family NTP-binding protein [Marinifilum sp. N1E240]MPQ45545.1 AAA family ATPase [Marinifilum sp. N1E240]